MKSAWTDRLRVATLLAAMHASLASAAVSPDKDSPLTRTADWSRMIRVLQTEFILTLDDAAVARLEEVCERAATEATRTSASPRSREDACLAAALKAIDDRGEYLSAEEAKRRDAESEQKFVGIGLELSRPSGTPGPIHVVKPIDHSPAQRAGILPGDDIVEIDGIDITTMPLQDVVRNVFRGAAGTTVTLRLKRGPEQSELVIAAIREPIRPISARARFFWESRVLYARVNQFTNNAVEHLAASLARERGGSPWKPRKLILDLRNNPGGLLSAGVEMGSFFVPPGTLVGYSRDRNGRIPHSTPGDLPEHVRALNPAVLRELNELPLTVLVNGGTAAGAEMLAQSLREQRGARIVGSPTFKNADVAVWRNLPSGARVRFTTSTLTSASDRSWVPEGVQIDDLRSDLRVEYGDPRTDRLLADQFER